MRFSTESFEPWTTLGSLFLNNKKMISLGAIALAAATTAIYYYLQNSSSKPKTADNTKQSFIAAEPASPQTGANSTTTSLGANSNATFSGNSNRSIILVNSKTGSEEEMPLDSPTKKPN